MAVGVSAHALGPVWLLVSSVLMRTHQRATTAGWHADGSKCANISRCGYWWDWRIILKVQCLDAASLLGSKSAGMGANTWSRAWLICVCMCALGGGGAALLPGLDPLPDLYVILVLVYQPEAAAASRARTHTATLRQGAPSFHVSAACTITMVRSWLRWQMAHLGWLAVRGPS